MNLRTLLLCSIVGSFVGCASGETGFFSPPADAAPPGDPWTSEDAAAGDASVVSVVVVSDDAGFIEPSPDDASPPDDASGAGANPPGPPFDAGEGGVCAQPLGPGSLAIVEILIESTSGTGDHGEWLEVESTLDCAIDLRGLLGECPVGAKVSTFAVTGDVWLPPRGTFLVADSTDAAINHDLPGTVFAWIGNPGDVLRNEGATITLLLGGALIDSVTYPSLKPTPGVSIAFPSDCPRTDRATWTDWHASAASWFPGFLGTPNAANVDVHCPVTPDD